MPGSKGNMNNGFRFSYSILLVIWLCSTIRAQNDQSFCSDGQALRQFLQNALPQPYPFDLSDSPCIWPGIKCFKNRVQLVDWENMGLNGPIPQGSFGKLEALVSLNLSNNSISGSVPTDLWDLPHLQSLNLAENLISGSISFTAQQPKAFASLSFLNLSHNRISGQIPSGIGSFKNLVSLDLSWNTLQGSVPDEIYLLEEFNLSYNLLSRNAHSRSILATTSQEDGFSVEQEKKALLSFKRSLLAQNNASNFLRTWKSEDETPCAWSGIQCRNSGGHVTVINLSFQGLTGPIPADGSLAKLGESLEHLFLQGNLFNGSIPEVIGNCSRLRTLDLSNNTHLSGRIPESLGRLSSQLQVLNLSSNNLVGGIPGSLFSDCKQLSVLDLSTNGLQGSIPEELNNCASLVALSFENNHLTGELPRNLGSAFESLSDLNLANNHFYGPIPSSLFSPSLQALDLSLNNFTEVPGTIGRCSKLINLTLSQNKLVEIPYEIGLLQSLETFLLGDNNLALLPDSISNCSSLRVLILNENHLQGEIPASIDNLRNLQYLVLHTNNFTGSIPDWIFTNHRQQLLHLDLSDNRITGNIPAWFNATFTSLKFLLLSGNHLQGSIPDSLGYVSDLQFLDLSNNQLTGSIPASLGNLQKMLWLMLAGNRLSGSIPAELGNCSSLLWLNAEGNLISGELPERLEFMGRHVKRTFDENSATLPPVPKEIGECAVVRRWLPSTYPPFSNVYTVLNRDRCQVFWNLLLRGKFMYSVCSRIPTEKSLGYIQLSGNRISGSIPESFGRIERLSLLFLYENRLSGPIPESLSALKLTGLNLSHNALTGGIPNSFGKFECLQSLDLSNNNLTGQIPSSLTNLTSLSRFNISFNPMLSGPIPFQQQFFTFDESSYIGDFRLCFFPLATGRTRPADTIPFCEDSTSTKTTGKLSLRPRVHVSTILGISLACALGLILLGLAGIFWISRSSSTASANLAAAAADYNSYNSFKVIKSSSGKFSSSSRELGMDSSVSIFTMDLPKQLTYNDLVHATGNFNESNVIGCGGFGIVYSAKLSDGSTVAIKKLIREGPAVEREFQAEMHTLGHVLHENLVPLIGYSSYGAHKLLVYEYMENGSLDDWLYGSPPGKAEGLDWPVRLDVAIGTARGLRFLHHSCCPAIIHRDMKASNILLDGSFRPRLTDFGLARALAAQEETHVSTIVAGTLGYVPPEYCQTWRATVKGDVYSFGVVLFELLSGRRPMLDVNNLNNKDNAGSDEFERCGNLVEWAVDCYRDNRLWRFFDPLVTKTGSQSDLMKFLKLAMDCTQDVPVRRPCMRDVVRRLEDIKEGV